jgi:hypothetical protein
MAVQLTVAAGWYSVLIVVSIVVAGVLVGVQTYPKLADLPIVNGLDMTVQCVFTFDCTIKIIQEGNAPLQYW